MDLRTNWIISIIVSLLLVGVLHYLWIDSTRSYNPNSGQIVDEAAVLKFLKLHQSKHGSEENEPPIYVYTGIYVDSIKFITAIDIQFTGYIWQIYEDGVHDGISRDFLLPQIVDIAGTATKDLTYQRRVGNKEIIGWYVEATLRQSFVYNKYPLDHKTAWIQLWHKDFDRNVILVPQLSSYSVPTGPGKKFGISHDIVLGGWTMEETFFDYNLSNFDTNFGLKDFVGEHNFPDLRFNLVLKRKFINALVINLIPLLVVLGLLFSVVMLSTSDQKEAEKFGFNTSMVFGTCSALFFVVLLAHIQVREQFQGVGIVYLEYFYLLMYLVILTVAMNAYYFSAVSARGLLDSRDTNNNTFKLMYWPCVLGAAVLITLFCL